jgi:hypothetical protein
VARTAMRTHKNITLVYGASILARPLISWQGGDLYVTAIELKNERNHSPQLATSWPTVVIQPVHHWVVKIN